MSFVVQTVLVGGPEPPSPGGSGEQSPAQEKAVQGVNGSEPKSQKSQKSLKRAMKVEDVNFLDASKEGNVSRFLNVRRQQVQNGGRGHLRRK